MGGVWGVYALRVHLEIVGVRAGVCACVRVCARACGCVSLRYIGVSRRMIRANADGMVLFIAEPHRV